MWVRSLMKNRVGLEWGFWMRTRFKSQSFWQNYSSAFNRNSEISGDVKLEQLQVKETALDDFDLPIKLKYGYLSSLVLKIPWKNLYNEPVIANIDGLNLIVVPNKVRNKYFSISNYFRENLDLKLCSVIHWKYVFCSKEADQSNPGFSWTVAFQISWKFWHFNKM